MTVASAARQWQTGGFSIIPIATNGTKAPMGRWAQFMERRASEEEMASWWDTSNPEPGIALVMGAVSGGAEMLELEARATDSVSLDWIRRELVQAGLEDLWDRLNAGYTEMSPSGGLHFIYRITDHPVPGNTKVARRFSTDEELREKPTDNIKVLVETRGEGGYVIVAPTAGYCHPSGEAWIRLTGTYGEVVSLTWAERELLHGAITEALDEMPTPPPAPPRAVIAPMLGSITDLRPGDDFENRVEWDDQLLLGGAGWQRAYSYRNGATSWVRPGKEVRDGISATTGRAADRDRLFVFSTSTLFPTEEPITKFRAYALLHHGGDNANAARELRHLGFGAREQGVKSIPDFPISGTIDEESLDEWPADDLGASERLAHRVRGQYTWIPEEKTWYQWTGGIWEADQHDQLVREYSDMMSELGGSGEEPVRKFASRHRSGGHVMHALRFARSWRGMSRCRCDFDLHRDKLNVLNGVLDLETGAFAPHDPELLMTRFFNANYKPDARCPRFDQFMTEVLPDPEVRAYVQRAVGYTLLGSADERAMFLVWGPSGTGKSQFMEAIQHVFGGYGLTASLGTFISSKEKGPSPDLHRLRGKRFVSTSETADNTRFDEEVVKRLTGGDTVTTRMLYQAEQEWRPECAIWIATNHKPRFSSDDDAIWKRAKLVPFLTRFGHEDSPAELSGFARRFLFREADGILNWMLDGLREFQKKGLAEPAAITEQSLLHRREVDPVASFLDEMEGDGRLEMVPSARMKTSSLYTMYQEWNRNMGDHPFSRRRFTNRVLATLGTGTIMRSNGSSMITGVGTGEREQPEDAPF